MKKKVLVAGVLLSVFSMGMSAQAAMTTTIINEGETELRRTVGTERYTFTGDANDPGISIVGDNEKVIDLKSDFEDSYFSISAFDRNNVTGDMIVHDAGKTVIQGLQLEFHALTSVGENDGYRAVVNKSGTLEFHNDVIANVHSNRELINNNGVINFYGDETIIGRIFESSTIPVAAVIKNETGAKIDINSTYVLISANGNTSNLSNKVEGTVLNNNGEFVLNKDNVMGNYYLYGDIEHEMGATTVLNLRSTEGYYSYLRGEVRGSDENFQLNLDHAAWILGFQQEDEVCGVSMKNESFIVTNGKNIPGEAIWEDNYKHLKLKNCTTDGTGFIEISTDLANDVGDKISFLGDVTPEKIMISIVNKDNNNNVPIKREDGHSVTIVDCSNDANIKIDTCLSFYGNYIDLESYYPIIDEIVEGNVKNWNFVGWEKGGNKTVNDETDQGKDAIDLNVIDLDNTLKRINDIRTDPSEVGAWLRGENGKMKIRSYGYKYNLMSGGYDWKYESDAAKMFLGFGISYAKNNCDTGIIGDTKSMGYNLYGSWLGRENNDYVDVIVKYGTLDKKYAGLDDNNVFVTGDYDKKLFSVAAKYGRRITRDDGWYYEPSVGLTWGRIGSADFTDSQGIKIHADSSTTKMATLGMQVGKNIQGTEFYGLFQVRHDFDGKMHVSVPGSDLPGSSVYDDMGGTWYKVGIGAARKINKNNSFYMDIEKDFGNKVKKPYAIGAGYRYTF